MASTARREAMPIMAARPFSSSLSFVSGPAFGASR